MGDGYVNTGKHESVLCVCLCWNYFGPLSTNTDFKQQLCIYLTFPFLYTVNIIKESSTEIFWTGDLKQKGFVYVALDRFTRVSIGGQVHTAHH